LGYDDPRSPLPAAIDPAQQIVIAPKKPAPIASPAQEPAPLHPLIAFERDPHNKIAVPEHLRLKHPLVRSTLARWRLGPARIGRTSLRVWTCVSALRSAVVPFGSCRSSLPHSKVEE
jgi:hypothetical protein